MQKLPALSASASFIKLTFLTVILTLLTSCTFIETDSLQARTFNHITLKMLQGTYSNMGFSKRMDMGPVLSELFFPKLDRAIKVETIVISVKSKVVTINAISNHKSVAQRSFTEGKDFTLSNGVINLSAKYDCADCREMGAVHYGLAKHGKQLRFNHNGDIILRESSKGLFMVMVVVPIATIQKNEYLYRKISNQSMINAKSQ